MELLYFMVLMVFICIGFYIAHRVCKNTSLVVRLILLAPMLTAIFSLMSMLGGSYTVCLADIIRELGWIATYVLLAMLLSGKRLLRNIDMGEREVCLG